MIRLGEKAEKSREKTNMLEPILYVLNIKKINITKKRKENAIVYLLLKNLLIPPIFTLMLSVSLIQNQRKHHFKTLLLLKETTYKPGL